MSPTLLVSRRRLAVAAALVAALALPLGALASHQFTDVPDANLYHNDIDALVDSGVTTGCGGGNYCPNANVTREQMAAFLNRLGALAPGKTPVVNADKLDGLDSTQFLRSGTVVQTVIGPWHLLKTWLGTATIDEYSTNTVVNGSVQTAVSLPVVAPASIGSQTYALASVKFCFIDASSTNASVWVLTASAVNEFGVGAGTMSDVTTRAIGADVCYTISGTPLAASNGIYLGIGAQFSAAGSLGIGKTTLTWTPVP